MKRNEDVFVCDSEAQGSTVYLGTFTSLCEV